MALASRRDSRRTASGALLVADWLAVGVDDGHLAEPERPNWPLHLRAVTDHHPSHCSGIERVGGLGHLRWRHRLDLGLALDHIVVGTLVADDVGHRRHHRGHRLVSTWQTADLGRLNLRELVAGWRPRARILADLSGHFLQRVSRFVDLYG